MLNRPPVKGLEFRLASAVAAVVPAAIRAAFVGSVISAGAAALHGSLVYLRNWQWTGGFAAEAAVEFGAVFVSTLFIGALIGLAFCCFYLVAIGVPVAWKLRERLGTSKGLVALLVTAPLAAWVASSLLGVGPMNWATRTSEWAFALACAYSIPAAIFFRRDIMIARQTGPFAED